MRGAYYNEIDPFAAEWLKNLIATGHIAPGDVDTRSIEDVSPDDLRGYTQCHFFAGIGVWSYALRRAGWPDDRPVWTGSCPCQPFSAAGKGKGVADERHLWPAFFHLIEQRRPAIVLGEQVASKDGLGWLDLVQADLEGAGYASAAFDLCAAGIGAPHIRQRLWFVAQRLEHAAGDGWQERRAEPGGRGVERGCGAGRMANADNAGPQGRHGEVLRERASQRAVGAGGASGRMAQPNGAGLQPGRESAASTGHGYPVGPACRDDRHEPAGPVNGFWRDSDWLFCRDGKWRPVRSGSFPLADGLAGRVGRLRAYGNAIVAPVAQAFIEAVMDTLDAMPMEAAE